MDTFSPAAGCVGRVETITHRDVESARVELDGISRELLSLQLVLELLQEDMTDDQSNRLPETLQVQFTGITSNSLKVVTEIQGILASHSGSEIDKAAKWALTGKGDVEKLRLSLEAHESALEIALEMVNL